MLVFCRTAHVLALGLWFGSVAFFTLAGLLIFEGFAQQTRPPAMGRQLWLPVPQEYDRPPPSPRFPNPLRLEQGSRLAGVAVGAIFPWYFGLQTGCALAALATSFVPHRGSGGGVSRAQILILSLGLLAVLAGWGLERHVEGLRGPRNGATDALLTQATLSAEQLQAAEAARAKFGAWHGVSLLANFAVLGLSAAGLALAGNLPTPAARPVSPPSE